MNENQLNRQVRELTDCERKGVVPINPTELMTQSHRSKLNTPVAALNDLEAYNRSQPRIDNEDQTPKPSTTKPPEESKENEKNHASETAKAKEGSSE